MNPLLATLGNAPLSQNVGLQVNTSSARSMNLKEKDPSRNPELSEAKDPLLKRSARFSDLGIGSAISAIQPAIEEPILEHC